MVNSANIWCAISVSETAAVEVRGLQLHEIQAIARQHGDFIVETLGRCAMANLKGLPASPAELSDVMREAWRRAPAIIATIINVASEGQAPDDLSLGLQIEILGTIVRLCLDEIGLPTIRAATWWAMLVVAANDDRPARATATLDQSAS